MATARQAALTLFRTLVATDVGVLMGVAGLFDLYIHPDAALVAMLS
ncbi:hypothetical protein H8L32_24165 [Undibacterium sp. CY18W]|uniref:MFS transporter n=1 Tax=Undibacterium hunanense TaxID=2762292 RepID=A0ABR6ZXI0_9BURK|nr:hypothetical protein [Undibacterium hunanense]MBC3920582.1 hypothetical protein [Undibacterium hunanense]